MKYFIFLIILISLLPAQNLEEYYDKLDSGKIEEVRTEIKDLSNKHPNNPKIQLVKGIVSRDGESSAKIFKGIVDRHPNTLIAERAKVELMKYNYTLGLYQKARNQAEKFVQKHPNSQALREVLILLLRSLRFSRDSLGVEKYREKLAKQNPNSDSLIKVIDYSSPYQVVDAKNYKGKRKNLNEDESYFTVQIGVFSNSENVKKIKQKLGKVAYKIYVKKKKDKAASSVQVGQFSERARARQAAQQIKDQLHLDYVLVKRIQK